MNRALNQAKNISPELPSVKKNNSNLKDQS